MQSFYAAKASGRFNPAFEPADSIGSECYISFLLVAHQR